MYRKGIPEVKFVGKVLYIRIAVQGKKKKKVKSMIPPYNREKGKTEWEGGESAWLSNMA